MLESMAHRAAHLSGHPLPLLLPLLLLASVAVGTAVYPRPSILYSQCDPRWGKDVMVQDTICQVGCLMSSTSMWLYNFNFSIAGQVSTPATLNSWLQKNKGYVDGDDFEETVLSNLDSRIAFDTPIHSGTALTPQQIRELLWDKSKALVFNVMQGRHFVLAYGYDTANATKFYVRDPGFNVDSYGYSDIVGYRSWTIR